MVIISRKKEAQVEVQETDKKSEKSEQPEDTKGDFVLEVCRECPAAIGVGVSRGKDPEFCAFDSEFCKEEIVYRFLVDLDINSGCPKQKG